MSSRLLAGAALGLASVGMALARAGVEAPALRGTVDPALLAPAPFPGSLPALPWPQRGEAAVAVDGVGVLGASPRQSPLPIASLTKLMTALVVLRDHPLRPGQRGPVLVITTADRAVYLAERAANDSTLAVRAGERISEHQLLEGLLIPSGDNAAGILARWDAGSLAAFVARMNATAATFGLRRTRYGDASGLAPSSASSAVDQTHLAEVALRNPVVRGIVRLAHVRLPVAGWVDNPDPLAGRPFVIGLKTGWTAVAGGCLILAVRRAEAGEPVTVVATALGQRGPAQLPRAAAVSQRLARIALSLVRRRRVALTRPVGRLATSWGAGVPLLAVGSVDLLGWPGLPVTIRVRLDRTLPALPIPAGTRLGTALVTAGAQSLPLPVVTARRLLAPSPPWWLRAS